MNCDGRKIDENPHWTYHIPAKFLICSHRCTSCGFPGSWKPTDKNIPTFHSASCTHMWKLFKDAGCELSEYPHIPSIYFGKQKEKGRNDLAPRIKRLQAAKKEFDKRLGSGKA